MEIVSRECKFVVHIPRVYENGKELRKDTHLIKELLTYEDGTTAPNLRVLEDFKRKVYVTKPAYRRHKDKKESEALDRLQEIETTESDMAFNLSKRLVGTYPKRAKIATMSDVSLSSYVYGTDVNSSTILKYMYQKKYPDANTPYRLAVFDIETDTITNEIIVASLCLDNKVYVVMKESMLLSKDRVESQLHYLYEKYIPKTDISSKIEPVFKIVETEVELIRWILEQAHNEQPDFVAVWNVNYDVPYMVKRLKEFGVDPKDVFSDPKLPENLRYFEYVEGQKAKVTASGVFKPKDPQEQWHVVRAACSFYWIDAMCAYYFIRQGGKTVPGGYSLDNILNFELGSKFKKLKFHNDPKIAELTGVDWHRYMVGNRPLEYVIYNIWDTMSILELDKKTKDLSLNLPLLSGYSSFDIFHQNPKKIIDALYFYYLDNGRVLATKARGRNDDNDTLLGLEDWIVTLPIERTSDSGLKVIEEDPTLVTNIRAHVYDSDQVSGYPNDTIAANVSRDTTSRELLSIEGFTKDIFKVENMNLIYGNVNAVQYCTTLLNFPKIEDLVPVELSAEDIKTINPDRREIDK